LVINVYVQFKLKPSSKFLNSHEVISTGRNKDFQKYLLIWSLTQRLWTRS